LLDWFNIILGIMVVAIVGFIVYAIRKTKAEIYRGLGPEPGERRMKQVIKEIRERDIRCPHCGRQSFAMLGTGNRYKCDTCHHEFEDVDHIPESN
jgi:DNA-directed RNA polymerase subunit RPC12/RpoP